MGDYIYLNFVIKVTTNKTLGSSTAENWKSVIKKASKERRFEPNL